MVKSRKNIKNNKNLLQKLRKAKIFLTKTGGVEIVAGSELSLISGNSMSRTNQLSRKWRHMARKSAMFLRTLFLPSTSSSITSNIIAQWF
jgi:hypothetical protein